MSSKIELLDCTLRDGAYIVDAKFGEAVIKGIISKLQNAGVEIIECGWLKNSEHVCGTSFYHVPQDVNQYIVEKSKNSTYVVMIDWDRYDLDNLPEYDGKSIDAIRVVFPHNKFKEGIAVGSEIKKKGYKVFFQAANTLAYSDEDLIALANEVNAVSPEAISVVDTFGAMYEEDLDRILSVLNKHLNKEIGIGFHSHNNQQMAFANSMHFVKYLVKTDRRIMVDSSLCGMGRGAGNATTELMVNFLNTKHNHNYDLDAIMDAIDIYMTGFQDNYTWGYSTPYYIAGMYCCHVNNIAYLQNNHRIKAKDLRNIIESLSPDDRKKYDYDLLEQKYMENQDRLVDDKETVAHIREEWGIKGETPRKVLLIAPGKSATTEQKKVQSFIDANNPIVIAVNALLPEYSYDYMFLTNYVRYDYARTTKAEQFNKTTKIFLSNVKKHGSEKELIVNYNRAIKRGWKCFDNSVICALRLMDRLHVEEVYIAGFDGFKDEYSDSYADESLQSLNPLNNWHELNEEVKDMFRDVKETTKLKIDLITESIYEEF